MNVKIGTGSVEVDKYPKLCPICHHAIAPKYSSGIISGDHKIDLAFQCTNCNSLFIGKYSDPRYSRIYSLNRVWPIVPQPVKFEKEIQEISPMFVETYNQAIYAEGNSLHQLTGIGLRKSLEFLIKDFLIAQKPEKEDTVKTSTLSQCINNFIDDNNLVEISKRATWLGNDETHYVRKWEDKDIKDLKILTQLTVNWIHNILLKDKYLAEMS